MQVMRRVVSSEYLFMNMYIVVTDECEKDANAHGCSADIERLVAAGNEGDLLKHFDNFPPPLLKKRLNRQLRLIAYTTEDSIIFVRILTRGSREYQKLLENPMSFPIPRERLVSATKPSLAVNDSHVNVNLENRVTSLERRMDQIEADLKGISERLGVLCQRAKSYHHTDPESALNQARKAAELICKELYDASGLGQSAKPAVKCNLDELIQQLHRNEIISRAIYLHLCVVRDYGNFGSHDQGSESMLITPDSASPCLEALACLAKWYVTQRVSHKKG